MDPIALVGALIIKGIIIAAYTAWKEKRDAS